MNWIEAIWMTRIDGVDAGYKRGVEDAIKAIRQGRDDFACGEDMGKITNSILDVAESRIKFLQTALSSQAPHPSSETES